MATNTASKMPAGVPEVFQAAHQVFVNLTTDRILRIELLTQAIHKGQDVVPALTEIAQIAHKIAGVAGTLGYPDIGDTARSVEQQLKADLSTDDAMRNWESISEEIETLLDALEDIR